MSEMPSESNRSRRGYGLGKSLDHDDVQEELIEATGDEAGFRLIRESVSGHVEAVAVASDAESVTVEAWSEVVATCQRVLAAAVDLPDAIMALTAADYWAEEDLACRTAWAKDAEDADHWDESDPSDGDGAGDPEALWADVWAADRRRQTINRTLADQILIWAISRDNVPSLEVTRLALISEARTSVESLEGRRARFDLAYLAQDAAGRLRHERAAA